MTKQEDNSQRLTLNIDMKTKECVCGSRRLPEECCGSSKLLNYTISMSAANYYNSNGLAISGNGEILRRVGKKNLPLIGQPTIRVSNIRTKGRSKLTALGDSTSQCNLNPDLLFLQFDHVLVVDTNTEESENGIRCATGIIRVEIKKYGNDEVRFGYAPSLLVEFRNPQHNPERTGWIMTMDAIKQSPHLSGKKIAVVTDHDVNAHKALNFRRESIIGSYKVPKNVRLIYGASDRGSHAINKLMRLADGLAKIGLKKTEERAQGDSLWTDGGKFLCDRFRTSRPDAKDIRWAITGTDSITYQRTMPPKK